jgi:maleamate amidohydrolase
METSDLTPREYNEQIKAKPNRARFGFGRKAAVVNIDIQKAYTLVDEFPTAYQTHPNQLGFVNDLVAANRARGGSVVWSFVAYMESGEDCGIWGTRTDTENSLQNIKRGSRRSELDDRLDVDRVRDAIYEKKMPSPFFETPLQSLLVWHQVDTVIITGGSTSGCVRAAAIDSVSRGYRTIVPEECVADKHEIPHFSNLADMSLKYADVLPVAEVLEYLQNGGDDA